MSHTISFHICSLQSIPQIFLSNIHGYDLHSFFDEYSKYSVEIITSNIPKAIIMCEIFASNIRHNYSHGVGSFHIFPINILYNVVTLLVLEMFIMNIQ